MKKLLISMIVVVMLLAGCLTIFAACEDAADYEHTIIFYSSQGDSLQTQTQNAIKTFEEKYPGWKVQHIAPGGYDQVLSKVRSDIQAGLQPDLAYCYADHVAQYLSSELVVDLNKYLLKADNYDVPLEDGTTKTVRIGFTQEEKDDFVEGYFNEGYASYYYGVPASYDKNALFTLPFVKSTELLYYNADALEELGLQPATTWDELWRQCAIIAEKWEGCTPLGYDSEANWFITTAMQRGFGYTTVEGDNRYIFNNDGAKAWLEEIAGYYDKGWITTQELYGSYTSGLFIKGPEKGGLVYCIGSSAGASNQKSSAFTTGVTGIPAYVDAQGKLHDECISQGPSLVMLRGGHSVSNPDEKEIMTWLFMKELLDPTFQATFSKASGYNPSRKSVYEVPFYADFLDNADSDVVARAALAAEGLTERYFTSPAFVGSSTAREQVGNVVQYVISGQKPDAAKALRDAYKNCGGK
ncbi:MAG: extracellular solute-binding protein [Clostridiales bacterium]|nr:extracellular solute-binding protein [Clostridiales bacterium]